MTYRTASKLTALVGALAIFTGWYDDASTRSIEMIMLGCTAMIVSAIYGTAARK